MDNAPNIDELLNSLKITKDDTESLTNTLKTSKELSKAEWEDVVAQYTDTINSINESITIAKDMLAEARDLAKQAGDSEYIESYASAAKSLSELFKSKISLINEYFRITTQIKMKEKDLEARKEIEDKKLLSKNSQKGPNGGTFIQNNFTLKGPRDLIFDAMFGEDDDVKKKAQEQLKMLNEIKTIDVE